MNWLKSLWANHIQKSMAGLLIAFDTLNLAALQAYQQDIVQAFGEKRGPWIFSTARIALGAIIFFRASQKKKQP